MKYSVAPKGVILCPKYLSAVSVSDAVKNAYGQGQVFAHISSVTRSASCSVTGYDLVTVVTLSPIAVPLATANGISSKSKDKENEQVSSNRSLRGCPCAVRVVTYDENERHLCGKHDRRCPCQRIHHPRECGRSEGGQVMDTKWIDADTLAIATLVADSEGISLEEAIRDQIALFS